MKPRRSAFLPIIVLAAAVCAVRPALAIDVTLSATVATPARPVVSGVTNLPDGSLLTVTLSRADGGKFAGIAATVQGGGFTAGPFTRDGHDLAPGPYKVDVTMEMSVQPHAVRAVVGSHGMQMQGPSLQQSSSGQYVDYQTEFTSVGGSDDDAAVPAAEPPAGEAWAVDSCRARLDFLNDTIRAKKVSGHEVVGGERDGWMADCVRQAAQVRTTEPELP